MSYRTAAKHSTERVCVLQPKWERLHPESERKKFRVFQVSESSSSSHHVYVLGSRPLSDHVYGFTPHDHAILLYLHRQALLSTSPIITSSCSSPTLSPSSNLVFRIVVVIASRLRSRIPSFIRSRLPHDHVILVLPSSPSLVVYIHDIHVMFFPVDIATQQSCSRSLCIHIVMYPRTPC